MKDQSLWLISWVAGVVVISAVLSFTALALYNLFFHPLARYPGPTFWVISRLPYVISLQRGNLVHDTKRIHDVYGKVVRLAPNELSYINAQAWQGIYGHRKLGRPEFQKNPIWAQPTPNGTYSLINATEQDHQRMRKPLTPAFGNKSIKDNEATIRKYVDLLVSQLTRRVRQGTPVVDMKDYYSWTTFDVFSDLGFDEPFNCLKDEKYHYWVAFLFSHLKAAAIMASINFYPFVKPILFAVTPKKVFDEAREHHDMSSAKMGRRINAKTDRKDVMSYLLRNVGENGMTLPELEASAATLILAGSEGTSALLTATTNFLVRYPKKQQKLAREIRSSFTGASAINLERLEKMPYIKAVLDEAMRIAPPVPTAIPRIVPPGGDRICGEIVPGGINQTFVGVHQFAAYRSTHNFTHPDQFIPERWLTEASPLYAPSPSDPPFSPSTFADDDKAVLQPFSVGPRNCVGINLAYHEMRLIIALLIWNFDFVVPEARYADLRKGSRKHGIMIFEAQKTYSLWQREPMEVQLVAVAREK